MAKKKKKAKKYWKVEGMQTETIYRTRFVEAETEEEAMEKAMSNDETDHLKEEEEDSTWGSWSATSDPEEVTEEEAKG